VSALRYVEPAPLATLRAGDVVCVSDAPTGVALALMEGERHRRFCRVVHVRRVGRNVVSLTVDWYGVPRTVAGGHTGVLGAMVAAPTEPDE
jgi:hypothetical protein